MSKAGTKLLAYWEVKDEGGSDPYATTIKMAISDDDGRTMGADSHALWQ